MNDQDEVTDRSDSRAGISLRELEVLQAIVEAGTSIGAARILGISQSAASRRLARLEGRLGLQLFERSGAAGLVPTVEALSINEQLAPVFDTLARIANHAGRAGPASGGTLTIVAPPTIAHRFLPARIVAFRKYNPDLRISFEVLASDSMLTGIAEGRFDIGLTDSRVAHDGIRDDLLLETQAICLLPAQHRLARARVIRPADLAGEDFIALSRRHSSRAAVDRLFDRAGVPLNIVLETSTNVATMEFVRAGLGVALLNPFPLAQQIGADIVLRPFLPVLSYRTSFLMQASRAPSSAVLAFMQSVRAGLNRAAYPAPSS